MAESSPLLKNGEQSHGAPVPKTINNLGSFSLLINNLVGPAMLGFPHLFQEAGILPTTLCTLFIFFCATLSGTLFSDAIGTIPNNKSFTLNIDFSTAFRMLAGESWYIIAETLFLVTCVVQTVAAVVSCAQSVDGLLASFILGHSYALQITPSLSFVQWSAQKCYEDQLSPVELPSETDDCTPFHDSGGLIITLGYLLTTLVFLPLGRGNLQETIGVQIMAFGSMCVLLVVFLFEFISKGFPTEVPMIGPSMSELAGVVLFNYAFIITVPSWLTEKKTNVSVNKIVWSASSLATLIYIGFGILGAMTFVGIGGNALVMLTSSKVHLITRICATLFGVSTIGSGVPVFCVMIRTAIYHSKLVSYSTSLFLGSIAPYLISWVLYQGTLLITLLNWTGLVVNGLVAFLLPMFLVLKAADRRRNQHHQDQQQQQLKSQETTSDVEMKGSSGPKKSPSAASGKPFFVSPYHQGIQPEAPTSAGGGGGGTGAVGASSVEPLPVWLEPYRKCIVIFMVVCFAIIIVSTTLADTISDVEATEQASNAAPRQQQHF